MGLSAQVVYELTCRCLSQRLLRFRCSSCCCQPTIALAVSISIFIGISEESRAFVWATVGSRWLW